MGDGVRHKLLKGLDMKIRSIVFPVDFSDRCAAVIPHVEAAARRFGASVTLLHMVEPLALPYGPLERLAFPGLQPASLMAKAEKMLDSFADSAFEGVTVWKVVETGDPASSIASLAREWNAGLIMMPTRGRGIFRAALLGSVAAKVLHDADCPVWTAAHVEMQTEGRHLEWRNIICAIDLSVDSSQLIQAARDLSRITGATVRIAHAVPGEESSPRQQAASSIQDMQSEAGTNFEVCIETGELPSAIANCVQRYDADLVLTGREVDRSVSRLRSHSYAIACGATCPVLSI
jgi:nucleotide-binding universal stress UspA family protein